MLNQTAVDNLYYANYVENYLDSVENLPDDVQRYLSRMHELDISYRSYLKDVDGYRDILEKDDLEHGAQRKILTKLEQVLILLQEVGDEKVEIGQHIIDLIDNKYRQLDQDLRNIDFCKDQENTEPGTKDSQNRETSGGGSGGLGVGSGGGTNGSGGNGGANTENGRGGVSKRPRRSRGESGGAADGGGDAGGRAKQAKKKKRKARGSGGGGEPVAGEVRPLATEEELLDEPTYCLCDQISYGEMILCDNDLCPIEWFHFVCVSLSSKPKGKWFCPKCRGDRPNVMKPKSQFLKELERYNKEKEEKS